MAEICLSGFGLRGFTKIGTPVWQPLAIIGISDGYYDPYKAYNQIEGK